MIVDQTIVDILRYGRAVPGHRFADSLNDPLKAIGWRHMRGASRTVAPWNRVVSSSDGISETAERLAREYRLPLVVDDGFDEIDLGLWSELEIEELMALDDPRLTAFQTAPVTALPPGAETLPDFQTRILTAWQRMLAEYNGEHLLLLCHGGVQRVLVANALGRPLEQLFAFQTPYAGLSRLNVVDMPESGLTTQLLFQSGVH